jgi:hypothetical protein
MAIMSIVFATNILIVFCVFESEKIAIREDKNIKNE